MDDKIYNEYYDKLYYWALKKTRNKEDASDLVHNTFCALYTYLNKGVEVLKLDNLIWKIAYNLWCRKAKEYYKERNIIYDDEIINNKEFDDIDIIDKIIYQEIKEKIENNEYNLTPKEKECFIQYYYYNLSVEEISNKINSNISSVKYYLFNSRKKIKGELIK